MDPKREAQIREVFASGALDLWDTKAFPKWSVCPPAPLSLGENPEESVKADQFVYEYQTILAPDDRLLFRIICEGIVLREGVVDR